MKHYLKYIDEGAYCGEKLSLTRSGLNWSSDITVHEDRVTCPECRSKIKADVARYKAYKEKRQLEKAAPDLLRALGFYSNRMSFTHEDGECSFMCKDEGDVARDAIEKAKSS